ncbi:N-acetyltransferase [Emcibacter sp.]|uniref:GNAT family N-acetyltransferase n=1 Tax=Emcibacter sp. TaxID=1979954 RepID=UPI002AA8B308|nr:N-acetyltransferase [Emcibacter sp.]
MSAIMNIRETETADLPVIMDIHRRAFGGEAEAELVRDLLADPTARPLLSLLAEGDAGPLGHVLFTSVRLAETVRGEEPVASLSILCPLAVVPEAQGQGVGGDLVRCGLEVLADVGAGLVFVLGHPGYYPRFGFTPAGRQGFATPYPIAEENADAWMVLALQPGLTGKLQGRVIGADSLMKPEYWVE